MKKLLILTACFSALFAEDPVAVTPALFEDQNSSVQVGEPVRETEAQKVQVASAELPASTAPEAALSHKLLS